MEKLQSVGVSEIEVCSFVPVKLWIPQPITLCPSVYRRKVPVATLDSLRGEPNWNTGCALLVVKSIANSTACAAPWND